MNKPALLLSMVVVALATGGRAQAQIGGDAGVSVNPYAPPTRSAPGAPSYDLGPSLTGPSPMVPLNGSTTVGDGIVQPPLVAADPFDASTCGGITCRFGKFYVVSEAVMFDRSEPFVRNISQQASTNFARLRTTDPNFDYWEVTPKITAGFLFCNNWAIESTMYYKDDFDAIANFGLTDDVNAVWFGTQPAASDWTGADQQNLRMASGLHSYELNVVDTVRGIQPIFGFRYIEFRDKMTVSTFDNANFSSGFIGTYNTLLGGQIGGKLNYEGESFGFDFTGKVGWYLNDAKVTTFIQDTNNTVTLRNLKRNSQNDAVVYELTAALYYRPVTCVTIRGGYQCLSIINTGLASDHINENPTAALNTTGFSPNTKGDILYHGPFLGAEMRF